MIRVGLIDGGISKKEFNIENSIEITSDLQVNNIDVSEGMESEHANICASVIKKYYKDVIFDSIKIFNSKINSSTKQVIRALEWCIDNKIKVINMSLGKCDYKAFIELSDIIKKASSEGCIIIASCCNENVATCPASYNNVIGVKASNMLREGEYIYNFYSLDGIEITACGEHELYYDNKVKKKCRNSFATPMITAKVCDLVSKYPKINVMQAKDLLYKEAINYIEDDEIEIGKTNIKAFIADKFYENVSEGVKIDVPIILISGKEKNVVNVALHNLKYHFRNDGYFSLPVTMNFESMLGGLVYLPFNKMDSIEAVKDKLEKLHGKFDSDFILLGVNNNDCLKNIEELKTLLKTKLLFDVNYENIKDLYDEVKEIIG